MAPSVWSSCELWQAETYIINADLNGIGPLIERKTHLIGAVMFHTGILTKFGLLHICWYRTRKCCLGWWWLWWSEWWWWWQRWWQRWRWWDWWHHFDLQVVAFAYHWIITTNAILQERDVVPGDKQWSLEPIVELGLKMISESTCKKNFCWPFRR